MGNKSNINKQNSNTQGKDFYQPIFLHHASLIQNNNLMLIFKMYANYYHKLMIKSIFVKKEMDNKMMSKILIFWRYNIQQFFFRKKKIKNSSLKDLKKLKKVYLSIDVDILDPSLISNVGNPEPDGLKFKEVIEAANEYKISMMFTGIRCFRH
jgi:hypothetical protein